MKFDKRFCLLLIFCVCVLNYVNAESVDLNSSGWTLVRRVSQNYGGWHPTNDNLMGTSVYGTATTDETADVTFSINFEDAVAGWIKFY